MVDVCFRSVGWALVGFTSESRDNRSQKAKENKIIKKKEIENKRRKEREKWKGKRGRGEDGGRAIPKGMNETITFGKGRKKHGKTPTPVNSIQFLVSAMQLSPHKTGLSLSLSRFARGRLFYKCSRLGRTPTEFEYNELFWIFIDARLPARLKCKFPHQLNVSHTIPRAVVLHTNAPQHSQWPPPFISRSHQNKDSIWILLYRKGELHENYALNDLSIGCQLVHFL